MMHVQKPTPIIFQQHKHTLKQHVYQDTSLSYSKFQCRRCRKRTILAPWIGTSWPLYLDYFYVHARCVLLTSNHMTQQNSVCCPLVFPLCPALVN